MRLRAEERDSSLTTALDYVAGVLGLCLHNNLVRTPITEQRYVYWDKYVHSSNSMRVNIIESHEWDVSDEGLTATKLGLPRLQGQWELQKAAGVLAWLLRAWAAEDPILEFVSLFIPLERVIPKPTVDQEWENARRAVRAIIEKEAVAQNRDELIKFVKTLRRPQAGLGRRFEQWATGATLPGWEHDVATFDRFNKMRNSLLHEGKTSPVETEDVRTLEHITAKYVRFALFGMRT